MPNFRLIGAAVKPAIRHEQTHKHTNKQTDAIFIYIDMGHGNSRQVKDAPKFKKKNIYIYLYI